MAATGSPIGRHLQQTQATSIERLWRQACAPVGAAERGGLPARCDRAWFLTTFCAGAGGDRAAGEPIWDLVRAFNMYDPLALLCALPSLHDSFDFAEYIIGSTTHRVVGLSKERSGMRDGAAMAEFMHRCFIDGIEGEERERQRHADDARVAVATIAALQAENARLRKAAGEQ